MKITILQGAFLPVPTALGGAVEKMWFALGKEFAKQGHEVVHISRLYGSFPEQEIIAGVKHLRVKGYETPASGLYLKFLDLLYTLRAKSIIPVDSDVIVTNTFWAPLVVTKKLKRRCFVDVARMPKGQMKFYKAAGRLRANSTVVAAAIKQELPVDRHSKVVMVPNPLPFDDFKQVNFKLKKPVLLYTGRVHPEKGLELLIHAFKNVKSTWCLKIVGPHEVGAGGGGDTYLHSLKKLALNSPIEFTGPVYCMDTLNGHYQEASIFVYPSVAEQGETFGLAPLEAMAWGCTTIVSDLPCFKDFLTSGDNGLIFNHRAPDAVQLLTDNINTAISNPELANTLASNAMNVRQSHSTSIIGKQFLDEFIEMTARPNL